MTPEDGPSTNAVAAAQVKHQAPHRAILEARVEAAHDALTAVAKPSEGDYSRALRALEQAKQDLAAEDGTTKSEVYIRCPNCCRVWTVTADHQPGTWCPECPRYGAASCNSTRVTVGVTDNEQQELNHWMRWGSDGYPVSKLGRKWSIPHFPVLYDTKREAVAQWERYIDALIDRKAGR